MRLIGLWWDVVEKRKRSVESLLWLYQRMLTLSNLASTCEATHASIVLSRDLGRIEGLLEERAIPIPSAWGTLGI